MRKVLGIDYGEARVGVAVSYGSLSEPLQVISLKQQDVWSELAQIISEYVVRDIVVGVSDREMAQKSKSFAQELEHRFQLPVHLVDESFSTKTVWQKLKDSGKTQKYRVVDHLAAAEILQEWLDQAGELS